MRGAPGPVVVGLAADGGDVARWGRFSALLALGPLFVKPALRGVRKQNYARPAWRTSRQGACGTACKAAESLLCRRGKRGAQSDVTITLPGAATSVREGVLYTKRTYVYEGATAVPISGTATGLVNGPARGLCDVCLCNV